MTGSVVDKLKDAFENFSGDKKTIIRILSIVLILLLAVVLRIHDERKADITIETAEAPEAVESSEYSEEVSSDTRTVIFVDIGGEVENPGVYQVTKDTRLFEVIDMAGGLTDDADADRVNRASFVEDGQKIIIPVKGSDSADGTEPASAISDPGSDGLININTASADELKELSGIGDVTAQKIIEYRSSKAFKSKEDIMSVDGIGSKTYEKIKDRITV